MYLLLSCVNKNGEAGRTSRVLLIGVVFTHANATGTRFLPALLAYIYIYINTLPKKLVYSREIISLEYFLPSIESV